MPYWDQSSNSGRGIPLVPPLRVLAVVASPCDLPPFDVEHCWRQLKETLAPLTEQGSLVLERVRPATEVALRGQLDHQAWHVLHFIGHGRGRAAQYNTIALENAEGTSRGITERYLAQLVHSHPALRLVVLQSGQGESAIFRSMAGALMRNGSTSVLVTGLLAERAQQIFLAKLYAGILMHLDPTAVVRDAQVALMDQHFDAVWFSPRERASGGAPFCSIAAGVFACEHINCADHRACARRCPSGRRETEGGHPERGIGRRVGAKASKLPV